MKQITYIAILVLCIFNCKAQPTSTSQYEEVALELEQADFQVHPYKGVYYKDVNNHLDKFTGTWLGAYNGNNFELLIEEYSTSYNGNRRDKLRLKYRITDASGNTLVETFSQPRHSAYIMTGKYLDQSGLSYVLSYTGLRSDCGQTGTVFIGSGWNTNNDTLRIYMIVEGEGYDPERCPDYTQFPIYFPKNTDPEFFLQKQ